MSVDITTEQINQAIILLKEVIDKHGSARVGWAVETVFNDPKAATNSRKEKVRGTICRTGEYEAVYNAERKDYFISINGQYLISQSIITTNKSVTELNNLMPDVLRKQIKIAFWSCVLALISVIFIALTAYSDATNHTESEIRGLRTEMQRQTEVLDKISRIIELRHVAAEKTPIDSNLNANDN